MGLMDKILKLGQEYASEAIEQGALERDAEGDFLGGTSPQAGDYEALRRLVKRQYDSDEKQEFEDAFARVMEAAFAKAGG